MWVRWFYHKYIGSWVSHLCSVSITAANATRRKNNTARNVEKTLLKVFMKTLNTLAYQVFKQYGDLDQQIILIIKIRKTDISDTP